MRWDMILGKSPALLNGGFLLVNIKNMFLCIDDLILQGSLVCNKNNGLAHRKQNVKNKTWKHALFFHSDTF